MSRRLLKHRKTGVIFPFSETLLKNNSNVVELDSDGEDPIEEVDATAQEKPAYDGDSIIIDKATKDELIDFAAQNYGKTLQKRDSIDNLRSQVRELIEAEE